MTDPDHDRIEAIEERLAELPSTTGLAAESDDEFRRRRLRIFRRHNEWRRGMPSLDALFEDDEHRAKALAGSLATELERVVELRGELAERGGAEPDTAAWARGLVRDWADVGAELPPAWGWGGAAQDMFVLVLEDLTARAVRNAEEGVRPRSDRVEVQVGRWRRFAIIGRRLVGRFLRPAPRHD